MCKFKKLSLTALLLPALLASCGGSKNEMEYVSVKIADSDNWSILDVKKGEVIATDEFSSAPSMIVDGVFFVKNGENEFELFNVENTKKRLGKSAYVEVTTFNPGEDVTPVVPADGAIVLIDKTGKEKATLDKAIKTCSSFSDGRAVVMDEKERCGVINEKGEYVVKPTYKGMSTFTDGVAMARKDNEKDDNSFNIYFIDTNGKELFHFKNDKYEKGSLFCEDVMVVANDENTAYLMDKKGKQGIKIGKWGSVYTSGSWINDGNIIFYDGEKYGVKTLEGEIVIRAKYEDLQFTVSGDLCAKKNDKYGVVNLKDEEVMPFDFDNVTALGSERYLINESGRYWNLVDNKNRTLCNEEFEDISAWTSVEVKSHYFNAQGAADRIAAHFTQSTVMDLGKGATLGSFPVSIKGDKDEYGRYATTIKKYEDGLEIGYVFDAEILKPIYETVDYGYGYTYQRETGTEFNNAAGLAAVTFTIYVTDYSNKAEGKFESAFENVLKNKGFTKNADGYYYSNSNTAITFGYANGEIGVIYYLDKKYALPGMALKREKRGSANSSGESLDIPATVDEPVEMVEEVPVAEEAVPATEAPATEYAY